MPKRTFGALLAMMTLAATMSSCAWWQLALSGAGGLTAFMTSRFNHLYTGQYQSADLGVLQEATSDVRLAFVECDDQGWFHDLRQARVVLDSLEALSARGNVSIVVYVHGWRHTASPKDRDVAAFKYTLSYLGQRLDREDFRQLRAIRTGQPNTTVFGIYVGWRGKMAPELPVPLAYLNFPVYASFWNRKDAAHVVGRGDVGEFLLHLDDLYARVNLRQNPEDAYRRNRMSLVVVGHSFGGHIVFDAIRDRLEGHLFQSFDSSDGDSSTLSARLYPRPHEREKVACRSLVRGFGDLVVLINPAIEADVYRRIDDMVQSGTFRNEQVPLLITVSAENDWARKRQFATARGLSMWGARKMKSQSPLLVRALGSYAPQITHDLVLREPSPETRRRAKQQILEAVREAREKEKTAPRSEVVEPVLVASAKPFYVEQTARPAFTERDSELVRLEARDGLQGIKPALVVRASKDVISGHSDFFRVGFVSWLSSYVLSIQKKNLMQDSSLVRQSK